MDNHRLVSPSYVKEIINEYQFRFKKRFGQNFLVDGNILQKILHSAELTEQDFVIEVGTGLGTLTTKLAPHCRKVISFEIDHDLVKIVTERINNKNVQIISSDALSLDWLDVLTQGGWQGEPVKLVANLPYYLTTRLIMKALEGNVPFTEVVVMVQKEVAERIMAIPGTKAYGVLSVAVAYYAQASLVAKAPRTVFMPAPDVDSAVVKLSTILPPVAVAPNDLFSVVRAAFGQRRKTIRNTLRSLCKNWKITDDQLEQVLIDLDISPSLRGETLSLPQFGALTERLIVLRR